MGYNHFRYARLVGGHVELGDPAMNSQITLRSGGEVFIDCAGGTQIAYRQGGGNMFTFERATTISTLIGGFATGNDLELKANSTDADKITIEGAGDIVFSPAGNVKFGTHTATGDAVSNGSIEIKDSGGTTRKLMTKA